MSAGTADRSARTVGKQRAMDVGPHCLQSRDQPNDTVLSTLNLAFFSPLNNLELSHGHDQASSSICFLDPINLTVNFN